MMVVTILLFCVFVVTINANNEHNQVQHCGDFHPQVMLDVDMLLGRWFVTEVLFHAQKENEIVKNHTECPTIYLSEIPPDPLLPGQDFIDNLNNRQENRHNTHDQQHNWDELMEPIVKMWREVSRGAQRKEGRKYTTISPNEDLENFRKQTLQKLRLVWNEQGTQIEYLLRYNESKLGYWMSFGLQNGSIHDKHGYPQFVGTIQVMKAVRSHAVLTFCHISLKHQFFSVVISRDPWMDAKDLTNIQNILQWKNLPVRHVRRTCVDYSGTTSFNGSVLVTLLVSYICFMLSRYVTTYK